MHYGDLNSKEVQKGRGICICFSCGSAGQEAAGNAGDLGSIPGLGRSPGEVHGLYSPWGHKESDMTE